MKYTHTDFDGTPCVKFEIDELQLGTAGDTALQPASSHMTLLHSEPISGTRQIAFWVSGTENLEPSGEMKETVMPGFWELVVHEYREKYAHD